MTPARVASPGRGSEEEREGDVGEDGYREEPPAPRGQPVEYARGALLLPERDGCHRLTRPRNTRMAQPTKKRSAQVR